MTAKYGTDTTTPLSPETVYAHAMAPENHDYDVPAELARFQDWLRAGRVSTIPMGVDLRVQDDVALGEIELYAEVLTAVAAADGPLSARELDEALGLERKNARDNLL